MIENGDILGCVEVLNKRNNQAFSPDDLNLMEILCEHISVAVKNCEKSKVSASEIRESMGSLQALRDQIQHMSSQENVLKSSIDRSKRVMEYSRKLSGVFKINDIVKQVVNQTKKLLKCDRATLFVLDEQKNMLWSKVAQGNEMIKIPKDKGLVGHAVMTKLCINIPDAYVDERFDKSIDAKTGYHTKSVLVLPILNEEKGNVVAAIQCINKENDGVFDENDVQFFEEFCKQISVSVGNALAYDATQQTMEKSSENLMYLNTQIKSMEERLKEEKNGAALLKKDLRCL